MKKPEAPTDDAAVSDELWAARLLRQAARPQPLSPGELDAIGARVLRPTLTATRRAPHWGWRVATSVFLLLCGGALMAGTARILRRSPVTAPAAAPVPEAPRPARVHVPAPPPAPAPAPLAEELVAQAPAARPAARVASPRSNETVIVEPRPVAAPLPSALREEAALLASALRRLREENDAAGALALLDEHDRRFGTAGLLGDEVSATRIEAWLRTGQHARALSVLDGRALRPTGAARALLAARADLRAEAGRCLAARDDFDLLLATGGAADAIEERALFGRASCLSREGDASAARVELERYLARFPDGAFAARARAALAR